MLSLQTVRKPPRSVRNDRIERTRLLEEVTCARTCNAEQRFQARGADLHGQLVMEPLEKQLVMR
jgi:hypothetical protein